MADVHWAEQLASEWEELALKLYGEGPAESERALIASTIESSARILRERAARATEEEP